MLSRDVDLRGTCVVMGSSLAMKIYGWCKKRKVLRKKKRTSQNLWALGGQEEAKSLPVVGFKIFFFGGVNFNE